MANGRQARAEAALTARSYGLMGRQASRTGKLIAGAFAVGSLVRLGAAAGRAGATYVSALNKIQALTDSTDKQIDRAAQRIEKNAGVFAKYGQTASDAALGVVELTKSGLSLDSSLRAVRGTMVLAKAGELEVADASMLVANTLNTFGLKAKAASRIANGLANAANISSADVTDLAESFKYVSPLAAKAGVSLDQTNAILAELANSGIKASQAGTAFRSFLLNLQAPTPAAANALKALNVQVYDAQGNMRPLPGLIDQLNRGLGRLSQEQQNANLKAIFGKIGITGAQVILKNGTKGLAEYTKGVKRAGAAQKLAESATKGLAGTLSSLKAQTVTTVQELYRRFSPALDKRLQSVASYLAENKDEIVAAATAAGKRLGPALESLGEFALSAGKYIKDTTVPALADLLPLVDGTAKAAKTAGDALNGLPGPVKEIGVQAALAALILPRMTAGVTTATAAVQNQITYLRVLKLEMQDTATRAQATSTMMQRLSGAAKAAAGIGGMVALTRAAGETNEGLKTLESVGGGALLGFSMGGPIGAAVGGLAGAILAVGTAGKKAGDSLQFAKPKVEDFAGSLNRVSGAATRAANDVARLSLQQSGAFEAGRRLGLSSRDLVAATLGQEGAVKRVDRALKSAERQQVRWAKSVGVMPGYLNQGAVDLTTLKNALGATTEEFKRDQAAAREAAIANGEFGRALKNIDQATRRKIVSRIDMSGWPEGERQIAGVLRGLVKVQDRKQIRTVLKTLGAKESVTDIQRVIRELNHLGDAKPEMKPALRSVQQFSLNAKRQAITAATEVSDSLKKGTGKARPDLTGFNAALRSSLTTSKRWATDGGTQVGANLKSGIFTGFSGTAAALAAEAASAVRQAVAAARAAGRIHSPSKEMEDKVGKPLADGLLQGFTKNVTRGSEGIKRALDKLRDLIEKRLDGKKQADRRKALLKSLKAEGAALRANGKLQDRIAKRLDKAQEKYKALIQRSRQFAASVKTGFQTYGSVVGLGTTGGGTAVTLPALLSQLAARAEVADQFTAIIEKLKGKLNKTSLRQLLEQAAQGDLEGALATAQAIASGGAAAVAQVNSLTAQISQAGAGLGDSAAQSLYGAGIRAAEGIVAGLKRRERKLDKIADHLADRLIDRISKQLGIGKTSAPNTANRSSVPATHTSRTPALDAYMRQVTQPSAGGNTYNITVTVPVGASSEEIGRTLAKHIDAYERAGGRRRGRRP
ncbi:phage tail tape measure protein [Nocardioides sp.]|uniref:phage tail tape measure protein n=1 Tax=Nocardioides sp. TaxID=35761 RepID=UPI0026184987|nr:phage tail tape measure protein [Nocardioides sp.]MDI6912200.1 phage tail tape measure protein [Nocardioides sp.]